MALPNVLKQFNLFNEGNSLLGVVEEVALPKLSRKMEAFQAGGMVAPVKIDLSNEEIEIEYTCGGYLVDAIKQYGASKASGVLLRFAGAYQRDDTGDVMAVEIVVRGRPAEIDTGNAKVGDKSLTKVKFPCTYYKLTVGGEVVAEIDALNFIFTINGNDLLASQRKAIGLA